MEDYDSGIGSIDSPMEPASPTEKSASVFETSTSSSPPSSAQCGDKLTTPAPKILSLETGNLSSLATSSESGECNGTAASIQSVEESAIQLTSDQMSLPHTSGQKSEETAHNSSLEGSDSIGSRDSVASSTSPSSPVQMSSRASTASRLSETSSRASTASRLSGLCPVLEEYRISISSLSTAITQLCEGKGRSLSWRIVGMYHNCTCGVSWVRVPPEAAHFS